MAPVVGALMVSALVACGGGNSSDGGGTGAKDVEKKVESAVGKSDAKLKGSTALDAAGYAITSVQSSKYSDYEIDGTTVRLSVIKGVALNGSECTIIEAATASDHPDATFVLVESDGTETPC